MRAFKSRRIIFHVREPILPISGSLTFRVNKILERVKPYDISLIIPSNQKSRLVDQKYNNAKIIRTKVSVPRIGTLKKYIASLLFAFETSRLLAKEIRSSCSCVLYGYGASAAVALGLIGGNVPCILDLFETELPFVMSEKTGLLRGPGKVIEEYIFSVANRPECQIIVLSNAMKRYISTKYDVSSNIHVVYDTTDPTLFSPIDYDVKIADPIVGFIGDIYYRDGVDVLIKAMAIVNKQMPNVKLWLVGDGPDKNRIRKIAHHIGIRKNLIISGWLPFREVVDLLPKMMIGVAPARPLLMNKLVIPRKIYEYMSAGVVTIASNLEANREIIKNKNSGFLVKSLNVEEFAETILRSLQDRKLYTRIQQQARKTIEELSVEREVGRIVDLIENAM